MTLTRTIDISEKFTTTRLSLSFKKGNLVGKKMFHEHLEQKFDFLLFMANFYLNFQSLSFKEKIEKKNAD